jgi:hypothetical protein
MKLILLLSTIFSFFLIKEKNIDSISVEYLGDSDKPIRVIYISTDTVPYSQRVVTVDYDDLPINFIVDKNEFNLIKSSINTTEKKKFEKSDSHGAKITVREGVSVTSYYITRKNYNVFFLKIDSLVNQEKNKDLIEHLALLRRENVGEWQRYDH